MGGPVTLAHPLIWRKGNVDMDEPQSLCQADRHPVILCGTDITKSFGGLRALDGVDFQLHEKEILGLIGPNGAGKTTLFNLIAGVYKPDQGIICFRDEPVTGLRPDQICKKGIARTFQITKPFLGMSVLENAVVGSYFGHHKRKGLKQCIEHAEGTLFLVGLEDKRNFLASQLTLGERKRLELARALSADPTVLLLDEVVAGLNPTEALDMVELIKKIRKEGVTILMIEHVMKAVMGASDRIIVLRHGQKIADASPEAIAVDKDVIEAYLGSGTYAHTQPS